MRLIYTVIIYLLLPFALMRLLVRSFREPALRLRLQERLGFIPSPEENQPLVWIHAVSVGEVRATRPLVDTIRNEYPHYRIVITTMTLTGAVTVNQLLGVSVTHCYVPYDLPGAVTRFIARIRPKCLIVMETELWPNLFYYCQQHGVPVILANGRMSSQAVQRYRLVAGLTRETLMKISMICAQSQSDADHFQALGATRVSITGSMKYDVNLDNDHVQRVADLKHAWHAPGPVWIAASTHPGEEQLMLQAHTRILEQFPEALLILAPRHPERFATVNVLCKQAGFSVLHRTSHSHPAATTRVFVLDTMGELPWFYAMAQVAFVGGSLVPIGGHNMLEPAAMGIPVITGPHVKNFQEIAKHLEEAGAARIVNNFHELTDALISLFSNDELRQDTGHRGRLVVENNRGGVEQCMQFIRPYLA